MESWDDDNFEPTPVAGAVAPTLNKWEGEDEDEEVKESWEDEEDVEKQQDEVKTSERPKKKNTLAERIAEKERKKREEMEKRMKEAQEEEISAEEKLRMEQESDLKVALETTFGGGDEDIVKSESTVLDLELPNSKEGMQEFADALSKKLLPLSKNIEYPLFAEQLLRNICATMSSLDIKKVKNTLDNLYMEKQKIEKGDKAKKHKGKGKAKLKMDDSNPLSYVNDFDDFEDFM